MGRRLVLSGLPAALLCLVLVMTPRSQSAAAVGLAPQRASSVGRDRLLERGVGAGGICDGRSGTHAGDSAIWTGHYVAAEAFRHAATGSPAARASVRDAVAALQRLVDVTGTDVLARW